MRPSLYLIAVTLFWGLSFPLMKGWHEAAHDCPGGELLATFTLIGLRMTLAAGIFAIIRPDLVRAAKPTDRIYAFSLGLVFFIGFSCQVTGLIWTTPALSGFLTSLGSAWVPIIAFILFRLPVRSVTLGGLAMGIFGAALLAELDQSTASGQSFGLGEFLTLLCSIVFAFQIIMLDRMGRRGNPAHFTVPMLATTGGLGLGAAIFLAAVGPGIRPWLRWTWAIISEINTAVSLAALVLISTILAFHLMNKYQPMVSANRAALIYLLEPVFAALFSISLGYDSVSTRLLLGGSLIIIGNLIVEAPGFFRRA